LAKRKKKSKFGFWSKKKKKKPTKAQAKAAREAAQARIRILAAVVAISAVLAGVGFGFFYLDKYVLSSSPVAKQQVALDPNMPEWVSGELASLIRLTAGDEKFDFDKQAASRAAKNLMEFEWLKNVKVTLTKDALKMTADYRKPIAMLKLGKKKYYLDKELTPLRHIPVPKLAIVEITGFSLRNLSDVRLQEDIIAATDIIKLLAAMDEVSKLEKPLLFEIASVDVSNFYGRKYSDQSKPNIILYAKDSTPILWGSEPGKTVGQIEATDQQKIASLYEIYEEKGTLLGRFKIIDLQNPN